MNMIRDNIFKALRDVEEQYPMKIVLAAHTGGRQVGIYHQTSDIDISIMFLPKQSNKHIEDDIDIQADDIDIVARNIKSQLQFYKKIYQQINDNAIVHMSSINKAYRPFVYIKAPQILKCTFIDCAGKYFESLFHTKIAVLFYEEKAHLNYKNAIIEDSVSEVNTRSYLFYARSLLSIKWVIERKTIPPTTLQELIGACTDGYIVDYLLSEIDRYKNSQDRNMTTTLNSYVDSYLRLILKEIDIYKESFSRLKKFNNDCINKIVVCAEANFINRITVG